MDHQNSSAPSRVQIMPTEQLNERFATLYRQYRPMVRATILGRLSAFGPADPHLAEDLTQNTFLAFYQRLHNDTSIRNAGGLLRVMARQSIGHHYRAMRNRYEQPADIGHWTFANRETAATGSGYYVPAPTGFRTATLTTRPGDSDPDMDEALRRARKTGGGK